MKQSFLAAFAVLPILFYISPAHAEPAQGDTDTIALPDVSFAPSNVPIIIPKASNSNQSLIKPGISEDAEQSYVTGVDEIAGNWRMVYGPLRSQNKSIRYAIHRPNGFIDFSCSSDGRQEVVIGIAGFRRSKGEVVNASVTVSDIQHNLPLTVTGDISKNSEESILYASGNDVGGILNTMSRIHSEQAIEDAIIISTGNRAITAPSPVPYQEAATVMQVCAGWHNHALVSALDKVK